MLICIASTGYIYEIDANQNLLWSYTAGGTVAKAYRYSSSYVTGIPTQDKLSSAINVFPNPTSGNITIEIKSVEADQETGLTIYSMLGKVVFSDVFSGKGNKEISMENMPDGLYILCFFQGSSAYRLKVIKK